MVNRITKLIFGTGLAIIALLAVLTVLAGPAIAADQCVIPGGGGGCLATIQTAINAASSGDTVRVVAGTYPERVTITKNLTLLGGCTTSACTTRNLGTSIINGGGLGVVISITNGAAVTVDGFTITAGNGTSNNGTGGGIFIRQATAIIRNNIITGNVASTNSGLGGVGGGVYVISSTNPVGIYNNTIQANTAYSVASGSQYGFGGGLTIDTASSAIITGNQVLSNMAVKTQVPSADANGYGGGIAVAGDSVTLANNTIRGNVGIASGHQGFGGGINVYSTPLVTLTNNVIVQNTAIISGTYGGGGGMTLDPGTNSGARYIVTSNTVMSNTAVVTAASSATPQDTSGDGGGIRVDGFNATNENLTLNGNHIIGNVAVRRMTTSGNDSKGHADGGGLLVRNLTNVLILNNEVRGNIAVENLSLNGDDIMDADTWGGRPAGGGILLGENDIVNVSNNQILNNITARQQSVNGVDSTSEGGGLTLNNPVSATISANTISGNTAVITGNITSAAGMNYNPSGGGMMTGCWDRPNCVLSLVGNTLSNNVAVRDLTISGSNAEGGSGGGGLSVDAVPILRLTDNSLLNNIAAITITGLNPSADGGGIRIEGYNWPNDSFTMQNNHLVGNIAARKMTASGAGSEGHAEGGGLMVRNFTTTLILSNEVRGNVAVENMVLNGDDGSNNWGGRPSGGGMHLSENDTVTVSNNQILDNITARQQSANQVGSSNEGGGLALTNPLSATISGNTVSGNIGVITGSITSSTGEWYGPSGGGIMAACWDRPTCSLSLVGNNVLNNVTAHGVTVGGSNAGGGAGGGGFSLSSVTALLQSNVISGNTSNLGGDGWGGGVDINQSTVTMQRNRILGNRMNTAYNGGSGGVWAWQSNVTSANDIYARNYDGIGGGDTSTLTLMNDTLYNNGYTGASVNDSATLLVTNTIIYSHETGLIENNLSAKLVGNYNLLSNTTNFDGGATGSANDILNQNPLFTNAASDDFHLANGSPAIDKGTSVGAPGVDFEGQSRPQGLGVDIGADERQTQSKTYLPTIRKNK